jgi:hypothetical protein
MLLTCIYVGEKAICIVCMFKKKRYIEVRPISVVSIYLLFFYIVNVWDCLDWNLSGPWKV